MIVVRKPASQATSTGTVDAQDSAVLVRPGVSRLKAFVLYLPRGFVVRFFTTDYRGIVRDQKEFIAN